MPLNSKTIRKYIADLFPNKMTNGIATLLDEKEVTAVKLELEKNPHLNQSVQLPKTDLEKELIIQQAMSFQAEKIKLFKLKMIDWKPK